MPLVEAQLRAAILLGMHVGVGQIWCAGSRASTRLAAILFVSIRPSSRANENHDDRHRRQTNANEAIITFSQMLKSHPPIAQRSPGRVTRNAAVSPTARRSSPSRAGQALTRRLLLPVRPCGRAAGRIPTEPLCAMAWSDAASDLMVAPVGRTPAPASKPK